MKLNQPQLARALSTQEFHATVAALAPHTAVFDCDGTLWSADAGSGFMTWSIENGILSPLACDRLNQHYDGYLNGRVSEEEICGQMVQVYAGLRESDLRAAAAEFFRTRIEPHIFPEMLDLVHSLQAAGTDIWAVSSTNVWVIEEGIARFGIPAGRVLGARAEIAGGIVTAGILDVPTGPGKVRALARVNISRPDAVFGNSVHDAAMLAIARGPFAVNPSPALAQQSIERGWSLFYPAAVRPAAWSRTQTA